MRKFVFSNTDCTRSACPLAQKVCTPDCKNLHGLFLRKPRITPLTMFDVGCRMYDVGCNKRCMMDDG